MHKIKKIICGLLVFCMILMSIMTESQTIQASSKKSGNDGQIHWEFKNNTLILSAVKGTKGKMKNYNKHIAPWNKLKSVKKIVVQDGITELSTCAFQIDGDIDSVIIAGTVKKIQSDCFFGCTKSVYFKDCVNTIEDDAFHGAENVFMPKTAKNISLYAFCAVGDISVTSLKKVYGYESANFFVDELMTIVEETRDNVCPIGEIEYYPNKKSSVKFVSLTESSTLSKAKVTSSLTLNKGENQALKVTLPAGFINVKKYTGNPADVKVTYKSSDSSVATVSSDGKVTGNKGGTAKITVTMQIKDGAKKTLTTKVTVK